MLLRIAVTIRLYVFICNTSVNFQLVYVLSTSDRVSEVREHLVCKISMQYICKKPKIERHLLRHLHLNLS